MQIFRLRAVLVAKASSNEYGVRFGTAAHRRRRYDTNRDQRIRNPIISSSNHLPGRDGDSVYVNGSRRETLGVTLPRDQFIETVAALRGVGPEDMTLKDRVLALTPAARSALLRRLSAILDAMRGHQLQWTAREFSNEVFALMADAYLRASSEPGAKVRHRQPPVRIVRLAEERFAAAEGSPVSLADLCAAAGVGRTVLYRAFHAVCGEPPLSYFRKRQLMQERSVLLDATPTRGAVKRIALDAGLTELGRFSAEYRRLYGESPSVTLNGRPAY